MNGKEKPATLAELRKRQDEINAKLEGERSPFRAIIDRTSVALVKTENPEQRQRDVAAARRRVGKSRRDQIAWLLAVANDPAPTSGEKSRRLSAEMAALIAATCGRGALTQSEMAPLGNAEHVEAMTKVHDWVRGTLDSSLRGRWTIKGPELGNDYEFGIDHGTPFYAGREGALFAIACHQLLSSPEAKRISRCAASQCDRWFLRRKRGMYCSPACGRDAKRVRYFATPPKERSDLHHEAYKDRVARRIGKNVKVHRRGPRSAKNSEDQNGKG